MTFQMPSSRYVLPQFLEETSFGTKQIDPYGKLFEERIVFLGTQVDDTSANDIMACLLYTSDAADEGLGVDLGGRRIIKKKTK